MMTDEIIGVVAPIVAVHGVVLAVVAVAIKKLLMRDAHKAVNTVRQVETEVRKKEAGVMRRIEEHENAFALKKAEAEESLARQRRDSEMEVNQLRDRLVEEARDESRRIVDQARQNEEKMKRQALLEAEEKAVDLGGRIVQMVFSETMDAALNGKFVAELLDALDEIDAANITVDADAAEFRTSHPLAAEQRERLRTMLRDKFGVEVEIHEKVEKELMGGLIFKLGSLEIDGSLLNRFNEAMAEVKKAG